MMAWLQESETVMQGTRRRQATHVRFFGAGRVSLIVSELKAEATIDAISSAVKSPNSTVSADDMGSEGDSERASESVNESTAKEMNLFGLLLAHFLAESHPAMAQR